MDRDVILEAIKPRNILEYYGIEGKKGRFLCPFHKDTNPSMTIKGDLIRCWSCMGSSINVIDFVMKYENIDFLKALQVLAELAGFETGSIEATARSRNIQIRKTLRDIDEEIANLETIRISGCSFVNIGAINSDIEALIKKKNAIIASIERSGNAWT